MPCKTAENRIKRTSPPEIFVNQSGFFSVGIKKAYIPFRTELFEIIDADDSVKYTGSTEFFGYDETSGDEVSVCNFTDFCENGLFRIRSGESISCLFEISDNPYGKVFHDLTKAFYYFRCGSALEEKYAGVYRHGSCHNEKATVLGNKEIKIDVSGGWHDAGDYGKYVTTGAVTAAYLMYAWKMFPQSFEKNPVNIPESGNGIPEILSEVRTELEWLMKMQRDDGAVYHKVTPFTHIGFVMPENDDSQQFVFSVSSNAAADMCAACALGAQVFSGYDKSFSDDLRKAAEKAMEWLENNPEFLPFRNPDGCNTGDYTEKSDKDNRCWAYSELYTLTGKEEYGVKMKELMRSGISLSALGYWEVGGLASMSYIMSGRADDEKLISDIKNAFYWEAHFYSDFAKNSAYSAAMNVSDYCWGSNFMLTKHAMCFAVSDIFNKSSRYEELTARQIDILLGANPLGICYVTGNGEYCCNDVHYRPAMADGIDECIPGLVAGGPDKNREDIHAAEFLPEGTPPMKCYFDRNDCYSLNEVTIYWNASAVFAIAYLLSK